MILHAIMCCIAQVPVPDDLPDEIAAQFFVSLGTYEPSVSQIHVFGAALLQHMVHVNNKCSTLIHQ